MTVLHKTARLSLSLKHPSCTCCGRGRTAERAHVRDEEQQSEPEGGQYGREQSARRGAGEGALRGPDLGGGFEVFEAEEVGREAEEDGKRGGGSHGWIQGRRR